MDLVESEIKHENIEGKISQLPSFIYQNSSQIPNIVLGGKKGGSKISFQ